MWRTDLEVNTIIRPYVYMSQNEKVPFVDIIMPAYNHEEFIGEAIESILMQHTKYSYQIVVGEDCSTDCTRKIVTDYYKRYPNKISLYLWKRNVGANRNLVQLLTGSNGKYIAFLEGDDYWTDPLKLEKQIDFLENHKEYVGAVHNVRCVNKEGELLHRDFDFYPICEEHIYGREQAERFELAAQTASLLCRNIWKDWTRKELETLFLSPGNGDVKINVVLGLLGDIYYFKDIMAEHRRIFEGDSWTAKSHDKNVLWLYYKMCCSIQKYIKRYQNRFLDTRKNFQAGFEESKVRLLSEFNLVNSNIYCKFLKRKLLGE